MRKTRIAFSLFAVLLLTMTSLLVAAIEPRNIVVQQSNSPVRIASYRARYSQDMGLRHTFQYQNRGTSKVIAIRFGMLSFDVFHKFIGKTTGTSMQELSGGKSAEGFWSTDSPAAPAFYTGIAWVESIRTEDGNIWNANEADVVTEARREDKDFDPVVLKMQPVLK